MAMVARTAAMTLAALAAVAVGAVHPHHQHGLGLEQDMAAAASAWATTLSEQFRTAEAAADGQMPAGGVRVVVRGQPLDPQCKITDEAAGATVDTTDRVPSTHPVGPVQLMCGSSTTSGFVIFNAKDEQGGIGMTDDDLLKEYVLREEGVIFKEDDPLDWNFDQFSPESISALSALFLRTPMSVETRQSPVLVVRALSSMINHAGDEASGQPGILEGKWSGEYDSGTAPTAWSSSSAILRQFVATDPPTPVSYGQCWVFSGLMTTLGRALGIPFRSVTNIHSGHDSGEKSSAGKKVYTGCIDEFYKEDEAGVLVPLPSTDSIWNYHVWNEAWLQRGDLSPPAPAGWQAVDSTPQELSPKSEKYECGPAPVSQILELIESKTDVTPDTADAVCGKYDMCFIMGEVAASTCQWVTSSSYSGDNCEPHPSNNKYCLHDKILGATGLQMLTNKPNTKETDDIMATYKPPAKDSNGTGWHMEEQTSSTDPAEPTTVISNSKTEISNSKTEISNSKNEFVKFKIEVGEGTGNVRTMTAHVGRPVFLKMHMQNLKDQAVSVDVAVAVRAAQYTNIKPVTLVAKGTNTTTTMLAPLATTTVDLTVDPSDYQTALAFTNTITIHATARVRRADSDSITSKPKGLEELEHERGFGLSAEEIDDGAAGCCGDVSVAGLHDTPQSYRMGDYHALPGLHLDRVVYKSHSGQFIYHLNRGKRWMIGGDVDSDDAGVVGSGGFCATSQAGKTVDIHYFDSAEWQLGNVVVSCTSPELVRSSSLEGRITLADMKAVVGGNDTLTPSAIASGLALSDQDVRSLFTRTDVLINPDGTMPMDDFLQVLDNNGDGLITPEEVAHSIYVTPSRLAQLTQFVSAGKRKPPAPGAAAVEPAMSSVAADAPTNPVIQLYLQTVKVKIDVSSVMSIQQAGGGEGGNDTVALVVDVMNPLTVTMTEVRLRVDADTFTICGSTGTCVGGYADLIEEVPDIPPEGRATIRITAKQTLPTRQAVAIALGSKELDTTARVVLVGSPAATDAPVPPSAGELPVGGQQAVEEGMLQAEEEDEFGPVES